MTNDKQTTTEGAAISVQRLVIMAVFVAMTFVVTTYINVRIPFLAANGGLVHLGNVPVFVAAAVFGKKEGAVTGAFGLGLFDLLNGWVAWAPFTFVICGLIGFTYGLITKGKYETRGISFQIAAVVIRPYVNPINPQITNACNKELKKEQTKEKRLETWN